jgi:hypothetical protein
MADSPNHPFASGADESGEWDFGDLLVSETESEPLGAAPGFESEANGPAFQLIDDAGGRFVIDSENGIVTLANEALLQNEFGALHNVRMRVRERSGAAYELALRLRISGHVPQMAEAAPLDAIDEPICAEPEATPAVEPTQSSFSAPQLHYVDDGAPINGDLFLAEDEPFGGLCYAQSWPAGDGAATLAPPTLRLSPTSADAHWTP